MLIGRTVEHESTIRAKHGVFRVLSFREPMTSYPESLLVRIGDKWKPFTPSTGSPKDVMPMIAISQAEIGVEPLTGKTIWFDVK